MYKFKEGERVALNFPPELPLDTDVINIPIVEWHRYAVGMQIIVTDYDARFVVSDHHIAQWGQISRVEFQELATHSAANQFVIPTKFLRPYQVTPVKNKLGNFPRKTQEV